MEDDLAELELLRRRAYGPDADIHGDTQALARLEELEDRARRRIAPETVESVTTPAAPRSATSARVGAVSGTTSGPIDARRQRWHFALVASAAGIAILLGAQAAQRASSDAPPADASSVVAPPPATRGTDSSETVLVEIPLAGSVTRYVPQTSPPRFPVQGELAWSESLGPVYGWTVWVARTESGRQCILLERGSESFGQCLTEDRFLAGMLEVSVPYGRVAPEYRPARMTGGQSIIFRWVPEMRVTVVLDAADITYFGDAD